MGLRYRIPFKDINNNSYEVQIYREDYTGETTELTGATSCFVVSGTDEDFMYHPVRTSSATLSVLDSDLLLDLYSINNQYAPVKLLKNGSLEWTGYIKPEQYTQPYSPIPQNIGVECVCALSTLEQIEYKQISILGSVTMWQLLKHLINSAKGGYKGVYIPNVYGSSYTLSTNVFEEIELIENNFLNDKMNCLEVLEAVCKFFNWSLFDCKGYLYFVDPDWNGEYKLYDEGLNEYTSVSVNEVLLQDIGFNGSDSNTLDIIPGYNKASVKAINNVFDDVVKDEDYEELNPIKEDFLITIYSGSDGPHGVRKQFLKPRYWKLYQYKDGISPSLPEEDVYLKNNNELNELYGALLMKEADYACVSNSDPTPEDSVTEFSYTDSIQIRVGESMSAGINLFGSNHAITMEGEYAVYEDCAISIDFSIDGFFDNNMVKKSSDFGNKVVNVLFECGGRYFNGQEWAESYSTFSIEIDKSGSIKSNRTPFMPYSGISGYVVPMDFFVGSPKITIFCPVWMTDDYTHYITGTKIRNLKFGYTKKDGVVEEGESGDRIYENVVNESYMSDAEEISFEISSYNRDGASYSKALIKKRWLTDNLYCKIVSLMIRPEELMIRRIVSRYEETKIKLTEALCMTDEITPITRIKERSMGNKAFRLTSGEWDYEQCRLILQMQEDVE